jgi:hypothetical protein
LPNLSSIHSLEVPNNVWGKCLLGIPIYTYTATWEPAEGKGKGKNYWETKETGLCSPFKYLKISSESHNHLICFIGYRMWFGKRLTKMWSNLRGSAHMSFDVSFWVLGCTFHGNKLIHASQPSNN